MRFHVKSRHRFSFNGSKFMYFFVLRKYFHHVFVLNKGPFVYYYQKKHISITHGHHNMRPCSIGKTAYFFVLFEVARGKRQAFVKSRFPEKPIMRSLPDTQPRLDPFGAHQQVKTLCLVKQEVIVTHIKIPFYTSQFL